MDVFILNTCFQNTLLCNFHDLVCRNLAIHIINIDATININTVTVCIVCVVQPIYTKICQRYCIVHYICCFSEEKIGIEPFDDIK